MRDTVPAPPVASINPTADMRKEINRLKQRVSELEIELALLRRAPKFEPSFEPGEWNVFPNEMAADEAAEDFPNSELIPVPYPQTYATTDPAGYLVEVQGPDGEFFGILAAS